MSNDYRLNLLSEELDKYKAVVLKLTEENEQLQQRLSNCEKFFDELGELLGIEAGCAYWQQLVLNNIKTLQVENKAYKSSIIANHDRAIGKRLEEVLEENEELKAGLCKQCDFQKQYFSETKKLLAENEELKKRQITKNGFICDCEQNVKYRQALEEIRAITEQDRNCMNSELSCCQCCDKLDLIKEIISEVLGEQE